jgi:hypothetical protein
MLLGVHSRKVAARTAGSKEILFAPKLPAAPLIAETGAGRRFLLSIVYVPVTIGREDSDGLLTAERGRLP